MHASAAEQRADFRASSIAGIEALSTKKYETDLSRYDWTKAKRGRLLARARKSLAPVPLDPELVAYFESPEAINAALRAIVDAAQLVKPAKAKTRRPAKKHVA